MSVCTRKTRRPSRLPIQLDCGVPVCRGWSQRRGRRRAKTTGYRKRETEKWFAKLTEAAKDAVVSRRER